MLPVTSRSKGQVFRSLERRPLGLHRVHGLRVHVAVLLAEALGQRLHGLVVLGRDALLGGHGGRVVPAVLLALDDTVGDVLLRALEPLDEAQALGEEHVVLAEGDVHAGQLLEQVVRHEARRQPRVRPGLPRDRRVDVRRVDEVGQALGEREVGPGARLPLLGPRDGPVEDGVEQADAGDGRRRKGELVVPPAGVLQDDPGRERIASASREAREDDLVRVDAELAGAVDDLAHGVDAVLDRRGEGVAGRQAVVDREDDGVERRHGGAGPAGVVSPLTQDPAPAVEVDDRGARPDGEGGRDPYFHLDLLLALVLGEGGVQPHVLGGRGGRRFRAVGDAESEDGSLADGLGPGVEVPPGAGLERVDVARRLRRRRIALGSNLQCHGYRVPEAGQNG